MIHGRNRYSFRLAAVGLALMLAVSACSSDSDDAAREPESDSVGETGGVGEADEPDEVDAPDDAAGDSEAGSHVVGGVLPLLEDLPVCAEIHALLGEAVADLAPVPDAEQEEETFEDAWRYGINCAWFSSEVVDPDSTDVFDYFENASGISFGITIDSQPEDKEALSALGWVGEDPRLDDAGGYLVTLGQDYDPTDPLGAVSPQVVIGQATFVFSAMGVMLSEAESLSHLTNDWAVEASLMLYEELTGTRT